MCIRWRAFAVLAALLPAAPLSAAPATLTQQVARAQAPGGGALLYREQHLLRSEGERPLERLVVYRCPGGAAFARKRVDYSASAQAPAFELVDARSGYREGLRRQGGRVELFFRPPGATADQQASLPAPPAVADAGFDEFIRAHWAALAQGKALPLQFALPSRLRAMQFSVRRAGALRIAGEEALLFRLRLDGLLGLLAPHIDVAYGARSRRLLRFEGLGNLRDARGEGQLSVRIDFPEPAAPANAAAWATALAEPLAGGCGSGQQADTSPVRTPADARQVIERKGV